LYRPHAQAQRQSLRRTAQSQSMHVTRRCKRTSARVKQTYDRATRGFNGAVIAFTVRASSISHCWRQGALYGGYAFAGSAHGRMGTSMNEVHDRINASMKVHGWATWLHLESELLRRAIELHSILLLSHVCNQAVAPESRCCHRMLSNPHPRRGLLPRGVHLMSRTQSKGHAHTLPAHKRAPWTSHL
jgi:hypothetical protein